MYKLNVTNDLETLKNTFTYTQSISLSQPNFWKYKDLKYIWVKLSSDKSSIFIVWTTWNINSNFFNIKYDYLKYIKLWTWFTIISWANIDTFSWSAYFVYKPYTIWSVFIKSENWTNTIYTWNQVIHFYTQSKYLLDKRCFSLSLNSWRLFETDCN